VGKDIKHQLESLGVSIEKTEESLMTEALRLPNLTHPDAPAGSEARILHQSPLPHFSFAPKDHLQLGEALDLFDFEAGARVAGSKFVFLKNQAALLELGLVSWAMQRIARKGFRPVITPDVAKLDLARSCGFQPRDPAEQLYTLEQQNLCLVGTAEIPLAGLLAQHTVDAEQLPLKLGGFSHCFRVEAGRGAGAKGLYRMHQFSKVEMFAFTRPEDSEKTHLEMLDLQIELVKELGLAYRVLDMPANELGNSAFRKYDVEIWMPAKGEWGEVTSTSNCTDYQAVRMNAFMSEKGEKKHLHTVNGTACATPRIIIGLLEYGQREDGSVDLPKCLAPFLGFDRIAKGDWWASSQSK
jgi:seryl-tRNA synthetase